MRTKMFPSEFKKFRGRVFQPELPQCDWVRWGAGVTGPSHLFVDDYRIEVAFRRPGHSLVKALACGSVTAPDYSVSWDAPDALAAFQCWRSAAVASYWQEHGVNVTPVLIWSEFYAGTDFIEPGSAVAVRGPRVREDQSNWQRGFYRSVEKLCPSEVLIVGGGYVRIAPDWQSRIYRLNSRGGKPYKQQF